MDAKLSLKKYIPKLEEELSIQNGFFNNLLKEDDWSFIIKIHTLFESSLSYLLTNYTGQNNLINIFSNLELSNKKTGKIAFAKAFNLLGKDERRYITFLSELRNKLIHNIKNVDFDLKNHIKAIPKPQKDSFIKAVDASYPEEEKYKKYILENPKEAIWHTGMYVLVLIYLQKSRAERKREYLNYRLKFGEDLEKEGRGVSPRQRTKGD